jgi:hypothetical protein
MTARIIPRTVPGGLPGGNPNRKTKTNSPSPPIGPRPIPPSRAPMTIEASSTVNSSQRSITTQSDSRASFCTLTTVSMRGRHPELNWNKWQVPVVLRLEVFSLRSEVRCQRPRRSRRGWFEG